MNKTHWKQLDYRIDSLSLIIKGIEKNIEELKEKVNQNSFYDGLWFLAESEATLGIAFIAFQNYINSSVYDRHESLVKQYEAYKEGNKLKGKESTDIELIISLANYYKHRDHPSNLSKPTVNVLLDFNLQYKKGTDIENSPLIKGLEILSENWDLQELITIVKDWRDELWKID